MSILDLTFAISITSFVELLLPEILFFDLPIYTIIIGLGSYDPEFYYEVVEIRNLLGNRQIFRF